MAALKRGVDEVAALLPRVASDYSPWGARLEVDHDLQAHVVMCRISLRTFAAITAAGHNIIASNDILSGAVLGVHADHICPWCG